jgi:ribosomal protein S18 acetylase RimI-like enzyme
MPWIVREAVWNLNKAVGQRWRGIDPLLPEPRDLPQGCADPLVVPGPGNRPLGAGVCTHQIVSPDSLNLTWGAATRYALTPRVSGQNAEDTLDRLLSQWHDHLARQPESSGDDTAAVISWPSRDVTGVRALLRHGMQPLTVLAARPARPSVPSLPRQDTRHRSPVAPSPGPGMRIRPAGPDDLNAVFALYMEVIRFDARFLAVVERPTTAAAIRREVVSTLRKARPWTWLAERDGRPVGLVMAEPPGDSSWVAPMTSQGPAAYISCMSVAPGERGQGIGTALVGRLHGELDAIGVRVTLLHHSQLNPLSVPFWSRMGYRPLWTIWDARPARTLR